MHREMVPLGWLVRISVVALLAVAALALPGAPAVEAQAIATPTISSIVPGDGQLTVHWTVPEPAPLINSYKVQWKSGSQNYSALARQITAGENDRSRTITGLSNGTQYTVRVIAKTWDNETISAEQTATAGTPAAAAAASSSASQDRIQLTSANVSYQGLAEEDSWRGISLHFDGPVTDQDQITIKYTLEPLNGASAADFGVAVNEQVTHTATGRLIYGEFRSLYGEADIPVIDDTLAEEGERVRVTIQEVGHTWLGESTGNQTTGTYHIYDLDSLQYWRSDDDNWTYNVQIADNDSLPDGPSNLQGEVWGTDRVHLRWQPGEDGGTVNDVEQPLRYQFRVDRSARRPVQAQELQALTGGLGRHRGRRHQLLYHPGPGHQPGPRDLRVLGAGGQRRRGLRADRTGTGGAAGLPACASQEPDGHGHRSQPGETGLGAQRPRRLHQRH